MTNEIEPWKRRLIVVGHIIAILLFWYVTATSFGDEEFSIFFPFSSFGIVIFIGIVIASYFTFISYKILKQNFSKRVYYYNITIAILTSIVIFYIYDYLGYSEIAVGRSIIILLSIIPTIFTKIVFDSKHIESEINTKFLEKWELYGLGTVHGGVLLFVLTLLSYTDIQAIIQRGELEVLLLFPFSIITLIIIYNILKQNKLSKNLSYINLVILLTIPSLYFAREGDIYVFFIIFVFSVPSFLNIICIKKYGEYPTIKVKDIKQIQREKRDEKTYPPVTKVDEELLKEPPKEKEIFVPEFQKISDASETVIEKTETKTTPRRESHRNEVDVKTAFGYKGAAIIYKLKIENNTSDPISDIKVYPYVPEVFLLRDKEKSIALIEQGSSQTVTFEIRPTGECGECNISGRVNYYDMASRKRQDIELEPKSLSIVCPMLHGKEISEAEWHDAVSNLVKAEENTNEIDMPAETLFTMVSRIVKDMHMYMQKPEVTQNQRLFNGVARFYGEGVKSLRYAAQVEVVGGAKKSKLLLKAWAEKEDALTGFYHGILDEIEKRVNVKEYIDDSIVQYNVHIGDKIGTLIKDSVVQRSTIGASARKCQDCGREVEANEKFCLECGAKL